MDQFLRLGFIRKVLGILSFQMGITVLFCLYSMNSKSFSDFQKQSFGTMIFFFII